MLEAEHMFSTYVADCAMLKVLVAESRIFATNLTRMGAASTHVARALEVALSVHRRGGCTSAQLQEMESVVVKLEGMAA